MRALVQRVASARVEVEGEVVGAIGQGLLVLFCAEAGDTDAELAWTLNKVAGLRVFDDGEGKMNLDVAAVGGAFLVVSQFTLIGDVRRGNRPSFARAAPIEAARARYDAFCAGLVARGHRVETGRFRATMAVHLVNDGPVTLLIDSRAVT